MGKWRSIGVLLQMDLWLSLTMRSLSNKLAESHLLPFLKVRLTDFACCYQSYGQKAGWFVSLANTDW